MIHSIKLQDADNFVTVDLLDSEHLHSLFGVTRIPKSNGLSDVLNWTIKRRKLLKNQMENLLRVQQWAITSTMLQATEEELNEMDPEIKEIAIKVREKYKDRSDIIQC